MSNSTPHEGASKAGAACNPSMRGTCTRVIDSTSASPTPPASRRLLPAGVFSSSRSSCSTADAEHPQILGATSECASKDSESLAPAPVSHLRTLDPCMLLSSQLKSWFEACATSTSSHWWYASLAVFTFTRTSGTSPSRCHARPLKSLSNHPQPCTNATRPAADTSISKHRALKLDQRHHNKLLSLCSNNQSRSDHRESTRTRQRWQSRRTSELLGNAENGQYRNSKQHKHRQHKQPPLGPPARHCDKSEKEFSPTSDAAVTCSG